MRHRHWSGAGRGFINQDVAEAARAVLARLAERIFGRASIPSLERGRGRPAVPRVGVLKKKFRIEQQRPDPRACDSLLDVSHHIR